MKIKRESFLHCYNERSNADNMHLNRLMWSNECGRYSGLPLLRCDTALFLTLLPCIVYSMGDD